MQPSRMGTVTHHFPTLQTLLNRASSSPISWSHLPEDIIDPSQPNFLIDPRFTHLTPSKLTKLLQTTTTLTPSLPASPRPPTPWDNSPPPSLAWSPQERNNMTYTDGSCLQTPEGNKCAAAIYTMATQTATTIDPDGLGITNTINRAELAGIWGALSKVIPTSSPAHILTDSLGSLLQIHKYLRAPRLFTWHPHMPVLEAIANCIAQRQAAGAHTSLSKVQDTHRSGR